MNYKIVGINYIVYTKNLNKTTLSMKKKERKKKNQKIWVDYVYTLRVLTITLKVYISNRPYNTENSCIVKTEQSFLTFRLTCFKRYFLKFCIIKYPLFLIGIYVSSSLNSTVNKTKDKNVTDSNKNL